MTEELKLLKKATQKEMDFYYKILYPIQDRVLEKIQSKGFYLTGGTPLSRFYFHHRFSDDLDFFYDGFKFPKEDFIIQPVDNMEFISFTRKLIGDLLGYAKTKNV